MEKTFEIRTLPAQPTLSVRQTRPVAELPQFFGESYGKVIALIGKRGAQPAGMAFALYHNMDMQALDIEAGFPVSYKLAGEGDIKAGVIPAGKYACGTHIGPYDQIEPLYTALKAWAEAQGCQTAGAAYEWYFSPPETPPDEIKTEVWFPLK